MYESLSVENWCTGKCAWLERHVLMFGSREKVRKF